LPEEEEKLLVFGNETLLSTALRNIVINACKYAAGATPTILLEFENGSLKIAVADKGPGIAKEDLDKIFQPFFRGDDHRSAVGFGLGLSLAYRIVKLHKGNIEVQSEKGKGSTFTIFLPSADYIQEA
jgi:two-component system, OmpR family, sensor histidine kinase ArlS